MVNGIVNPPIASAQISPEQQLVERYAPVVMLKKQQAFCDKEGEGYFPAPVDFLFDNPDIKLRHQRRR